MSSTSPGGPPGPRLSDGDRDRVIEFLKTSCGEGRITLDEFSDRVDAACHAISLADVGPVLVGLPHPFGPDFTGVLSGATDGTPVPAAPLVPDTEGRRPTRWTVSIMGGSQRRGRWRLRGKTNAIAVMGGCRLDMRKAEVEGSSVVISAVAVMGGIDIIVPEGIEVELGGLAIMGGKDARVKDVTPILGLPVVRVKAFAFWGSVNVRSKPSSPSRPDDPQIEAHRQPAVVQGSGGPASSGASRLIDVVAEGRDGSGGDLGTAGLPEGTVTIMFTDIEGFTQVTERLGDRKAMGLLREHNEIIRQRVVTSGGHEVKAQGDGFMVAFSGANQALECAVGIQSDFADRNGSNPETPIRVRLGLHAGEAVRDGDDFLGGAVILAARIAQQAEGGETLVSSVLKDLCDLSGEFRFENGKDLYLKGLTEPRRVYSVSRVQPESG